MQNEFQGNTRENVTMSASLSQSNSYLPSSSFPSSSFTSSSWPRLHDTSSKLFSKLAQEERNNPVPDETFAILNHLQSITEQTLALQVRKSCDFYLFYSLTDFLNPPILIDEIKTRICKETTRSFPSKFLRSDYFW